MSFGETVRAEGIVTSIGGNAVLYLLNCKVDVLRRAPVVGDVVKFRHRAGLVRLADRDSNGFMEEGGRQLPPISLLEWPTDEEVRMFIEAETLARLAVFDDEQLVAEMLRRYQKKKEQKDAGEK